MFENNVKLIPEYILNVCQTNQCMWMPLEYVEPEVSGTLGGSLTEHLTGVGSRKLACKTTIYDCY